MRVEEGIGEDAAANLAHLDWYRRLADVFREVLSERSLDALLERVADTMSDLVPYDTMTVYEADDAQQLLTPVFARDRWVEEIMQSRCKFGQGVTGWAVLHGEAVLTNEAHLDPRAQSIPGTPDEPEAMISIPLVSRDATKGALNLYRLGDGASFSEAEFELARRFGDAAALAIDNAKILAALEQQAVTDPLTGLYNHRHFQERLRAELNRANRFRDAVGLLMVDIDDFKKINDVHGHSTGDSILVALANLLKQEVRGSDVACRIGGEEFAVILPSCDAGDALGLATRLLNEVGELDIEGIRGISISAGVSQGPEHAMNPRDLYAYAEAAMLTAKAKGGNRVVLFDEELHDRGGTSSESKRDVRSVAHLKMLQSLSGKLNRLNDVAEIATTIANELRSLIDYHNCRVFLVEGDELMPVAVRGDLMDYPRARGHYSTLKVGEGITGRAALTGGSVVVPNALECDFAILSGAGDIEESVLSVPLNYGTTTIGVVTVSKLGIDQFAEDDVRVLEVLASQASVALENARLYQAQRREAEHAKALLEFADVVSKAPSLEAIGDETVSMAARLLDTLQSSLWMQDQPTGDFHCVAHRGYEGTDAEPLVQEHIDAISGENFLWGREAPNIVTPELQDEFFRTPPTVERRTIAVAPLRPGHGVRGWISVRAPEVGDGFFNRERLTLLEGLSYQASVAMQKASLYRAQKEEAEVANALLQFSRELAAAEGLDEVLSRVVMQAARILGSPKTSVWLQDHTGDLRCEADCGYTAGESAHLSTVRFRDEIAQRFLASHEPFVTRADQIQYIEQAHEIGGSLVFAVAPINLDDRVACITAVAPSVGDYQFSDKKMRLLAGIADQAKLAITNASSYASLERTFFETVEALANALEAKDEYTSSHARTITDMVLSVGTELGIEGHDLKRLELGALFHDIGKIGIPSDILRKPGPLDDEEWKIIRTHPELGEMILAPIDRLAEVRPIVRHCHEHYDGSGYPDAISADQIPIESRIILVCDAFDAMTSDRPYRKRLPVEEASRRLQEASGKQFDPRVVEAFLRTLGSTEQEEVA